MNVPTPRQLNQCPELGVLALLDLALDLATRELLAAHPQLHGEEPPYWALEPSPSAHAARLMLPKIRQLLLSLDEYRRVAQQEQSDKPLEHDIRF